MTAEDLPPRLTDGLSDTRRPASFIVPTGKKVLHPSTVYPAVRKSIPIYVKNNYDHSHPGTKIIDDAVIDLAQPVISITSMSVRSEVCMMQCVSLTCTQLY